MDPDRSAIPQSRGACSAGLEGSRHVRGLRSTTTKAVEAPQRCACRFRCAARAKSCHIAFSQKVCLYDDSNFHIRSYHHISYHHDGQTSPRKKLKPTRHTQHNALGLAQYRQPLMNSCVHHMRPSKHMQSYSTPTSTANEGHASRPFRHHQTPARHRLATHVHATRQLQHCMLPATFSIPAEHCIPCLNTLCKHT